MSGSKGGKKAAEFEELTEKLYRVYKKKCNDENVPIVKSLEAKFNDARENGSDIKEIYIWDEVGFIGVRILLDALREVEYPCVHFLRFWRSNCEDEGVRAVVQFMEHVPTIKALEFMNCNISSLGCEFLGRVLQPEARTPLKELKLDHNLFGDEGIGALAKGMRGNAKLEKLSMSYCGITHEATPALREILASKFSVLKSLNIQGNRLGNIGIKGILPFLKLSPSIETLIFADNGVKEEKTSDESDNDESKEEEELKVEPVFNQRYLSGLGGIREMSEEKPEETQKQSGVDAEGDDDEKPKQNLPYLSVEPGKLPDDMVSLICYIMYHNTNVKEYDWRLNEFSDYSAKKFLETLQAATHVQRFDINDKINHQLYMDILAQLKLNKPKKGKKGKKGRKKKKT